jgi:hypothetical protein
MRFRLRSLSLLLLAVPFSAACGVQGDETQSGSGAQTSGGPTLFRETTTTALKDQPCGPGKSTGCYTNYGVVVDLDGDGKLDLVMANGGGHFVPESPEPQAIYYGDGAGNFTNGIPTLTGMTPSIVRQVAVADFDGDGRLDIFMPGGYGGTPDQLFMQVAPRSFHNDPSRIGGTSSHVGGVHAGDIDGDGDFDLVLADWGDHPNPDDSKVPASAVTVRILENDGTGHFTEKTSLPAPDGSSATDVDLQDVDGDFALDIVLTNRNGHSRLYLNDGKGAFTDVTDSKAFPGKGKEAISFNAELCDVDADGDLDVMFDGGSGDVQGHDTQLLLNDGSGGFTDATTRILGEATSDDNQVKCADVDNDGDFDLVVASLSNPTEKLLRNDGHGNFQNVANAFPAVRDPTLTIDLGDFDGDGKVDLFTGQGEVHSQPFLNRIYKNLTTAPDVHKPIFRKVERPTPAAGQPVVFRFAVSDSHTSETGQHVKSVSVDLVVAGQHTKVDAKFMGGDLFRAVLPAQTAGTSFTATPHATDPVGNEAIGDAVSLSVQ